MILGRRAATFVRPPAESLDQALSLIHNSEPTRLRCISYAVFCVKRGWGTALCVVRDAPWGAGRAMAARGQSLDQACRITGDATS
jgi:hypothetical protein